MNPAETNSAVARAKRQRELERRTVGHLLAMISGREMVAVTSTGLRPVSALQPKLVRWNQAKAIKEALVSAGNPDFDLQDAMPLGEGIDLSLGRQVLMAFRQPVGQVRFVSLPQFEDLARDRDPSPISADDIRQRMQDVPQPGDNETPSSEFGGPMTLILFAGGGFSDDARRVAKTFVDGPPTILIEPDDVGGFTITAPDAAAALAATFNPESLDGQVDRVGEALERRRVDLLTGGVALDAVAEETKLPLPLVERAAARWADRSGEPLRVKTIAGVPSLFRDASLERPDSSARSAGASGTIAVMDRVRRLLGKGVSVEKRLAALAEQRAALSRQRDRQYDEMARLEDRERELRDAFQNDDSENAKRRITSQTLQLRKDIDRRRQTVSMLNQQINVVGTHLHNLELARAGSAAGKLPSAEELADDAAKAEEVLAELQVSSELADELAGQAAGTSTTLSAEEQALYDELAADTDPTDDEANKPAFTREIPVTPKATTPTPTVPAEEELAEEPAPTPAAPERTRQAEPG
ncbi:MAG: hypothetical protein AAGI46_04760 [Planctomycetota bacterium]